MQGLQAMLQDTVWPVGGSVIEVLRAGLRTMKGESEERHLLGLHQMWDLLTGGWVVNTVTKTIQQVC